jgi:hypothetical protein
MIAIRAAKIAMVRAAMVRLRIEVGDLVGADDVFAAKGVR